MTSYVHCTWRLSISHQFAVDMQIFYSSDQKHLPTGTVVKLTRGVASRDFFVDIYARRLIDFQSVPMVVKASRRGLGRLRQLNKVRIYPLQVESITILSRSHP